VNVLSVFKSAQPVDLDAERIRRGRIETARKAQNFEEIDRADLVPRGPGWLVSAESDQIYTPHKGTVFANGSAALLADRVALWFYLDDDGDIRFLERLGETWSNIVARQASAS
jgi:hypothetical protein